MGSSGLEKLVRATPLDDSDALRDRFRVVMLGMAVGNALGLPVEGHSAHSIRRRFPEGITEVNAQERERPWDDDLAQAAILAEALIESGEFDPEKFAARLAAWAQENGRGIGVLTQSVIDELAKGRPSHEAATARSCVALPWPFDTFAPEETWFVLPGRARSLLTTTLAVSGARSLRRWPWQPA
jgi:hypothetical protein